MLTTAARLILKNSRLVIRGLLDDPLEAFAAFYDHVQTDRDIRRKRAFNGVPAVTYFFASSGGYTENVEDAWPGATPDPWLRGVPDPVKEKLLTNMSERGAQMLQEEMEVQQPQRKRDVDAAKGRIVAVVRRLEEAGTIVIGGGDEENEEDAVV